MANINGMSQARSNLLMCPRHGSRYIKQRLRGFRMKGNYATYALALVLVFVIAITPIEVIGEMNSNNNSEPNSGKVVLVMKMSLHNGSGNSDNASLAPHLVELYSATWCIPCRKVESQIDELNVWWPAVETIALHPSQESPDQLATNISYELYNYYNLSGFPTLIIDGFWIMMGDKQSADLQTLLTNISNDNLPSESNTTLNFNWELSDNNLTINWILSSTINVSIDFIITENDVPIPKTSMYLDNIVRAGLVNQSNSGSNIIDINNSNGNNLSITAIVRVSGTPNLVFGSEIPLDSELSDTWIEPSPTRSISPETIALFTIITLVLAIIPLRHTLPVLFRSNNPQITSIIEEE